MLCKCGYAMEELEGCSNYELAEMCKTSNSNQDSAEGTYEHREQNNYMFFGNLETMKNMIDEYWGWENEQTIGMLEKFIKSYFDEDQIVYMLENYIRDNMEI